MSKQGLRENETHGPKRQSQTETPGRWEMDPTRASPGGESACAPLAGLVRLRPWTLVEDKTHVTWGTGLMAPTLRSHKYQASKERSRSALSVTKGWAIGSSLGPPFPTGHPGSVPTPALHPLLFLFRVTSFTTVPSVQEEQAGGWWIIDPF